MYLNDLKIGQSARISKLYINKLEKRRLYDLGLIEGTLIKCVLDNPFNDPKAYEIRGSIFALRESHTSKIKVEL